MLKNIPTTDPAEFIKAIAKQHNVVYENTLYDGLADTITRLSDDDVVMDEVEILIIALERAGILSSEDVVPLHVNYLREKFVDI